MEKKLFNAILIVFVAVGLSSCSLMKLLSSSPEYVRVTVNQTSAEWDGFSVKLIGSDSREESFEQSISWGLTQVGLAQGDWKLDVLVNDSDGNLVGFGTKTVAVSGGSTSDVVIDPLDLAEGTLSIAIDGIHEEISFGTESEATAQVDNGSGPFEYHWYIDGEAVGRDSVLTLAGATDLGDHEATVIIIDPAGHDSGMGQVDFTVVPYSIIRHQGDGFTITWNSSGDNSVVEGYNVYFREHHASEWSFFSNIPSEEALEIDIDTTVLAPGRWDFGISYVDSEGIESEIHSSLDADAIPSNGWYLDWTI